MVKSVTMARACVLDGKKFGLSGVTIDPLNGGYRCSLRACPNDIGALSQALGITLPELPKTSVSSKGRLAMWLGPDEWLIYDAKSNPVEGLSQVAVAYSAVDISHRNTAIEVSGPMAGDVINAGCPQDISLEAFPVGACSRTIMGKVEVVLYRSTKTMFHVECWRSFAPYVFEMLCTAAKDQSALAAVTD